MDPLYDPSLTNERDKNRKTGGKMKRRYLIVIMHLLLLAGILYGCGAGPGSPGSSGSENTGVSIEATATGTYNNSNTYSVDAHQDVCDAGPPPVYEIFTDHGATITITTRLLNTNTTAIPAELYVEKYTVEYRRLNDSIGAPPIETFVGYDSFNLSPPTGTGTNTVTTSVVLVDLTRKLQYWADVTSGQYSSASSLNNYTAIFTFEGKNAYGTHFTFKTQMNFQIGNFDNC
jgi:hypothetical protein